jgi:hypothetical protein
VTGGMLLVLPEREDAEAAAEELLDGGWAPCEVHSERLAGDDDPEAVEWVVTLATAPDGSPADEHRASLDLMAEQYEGFATPWED